MTDLRVFRRSADRREVELAGSTVRLERDLQRRVEAGLEEMLGIRLVASEYTTGRWHRGRVDTLGLDENNAPVVIEFKRGVDAGVVTQAMFYVAWLKSARLEFEALVRERLGEKAAATVDWRRPRAVCVAAGFSNHDRVMVQERREPVDLVRYRVFDDGGEGLLALHLVDSVSWVSAADEVEQPASERIVEVAAEVAAGVPGVVAVPECLRELYGEVDEALCAWGEVEVVPLRHYIAYRRMRNLGSVVFRPSLGQVLVTLRLDPDTVELEEGFTRDLRGIGHLGTGDLEVKVSSAEDVERASPLFRRAFEAA